MALVPTCSYPAAFAEGDQGWAVEVLQLNLNAWRELENLTPLLVEDGNFGGRTERAVRTVQRRRSLLIDGIAGPRTQKRLALDLMRPAAAAEGVEACVIRGFTSLEATYLVAAVNCRGEGKPGKDCGWNQWRVYDEGATEQQYRDAFHGPTAFRRTARVLADRTRDLGSLDYAILAHNWWAAAVQYGKGTIDSWVYTSRDEQYRMRDAAPWIVEKDIDGVTTGFDWATFYTGRVRRYCG